MSEWFYCKRYNRSLALWLFIFRQCMTPYTWSLSINLPWTSSRFATLCLSKTCLNLLLWFSNVLPNIGLSNSPTGSPLVLTPSIFETSGRIEQYEEHYIKVIQPLPRDNFHVILVLFVHFHFPIFSQVSKTIWIRSGCLSLYYNPIFASLNFHVKSNACPSFRRRQWAMIRVCRKVQQFYA